MSSRSQAGGVPTETSTVSLLREGSRNDGWTRYADDAVRFERAVLGCLIEEPSLWSDADLNTDDFLLADHQRILQALIRLHSDDQPV